MDTITTTLNRVPFTEIVAHEKKVELREIKPYWTRRLKKVKTPFRLVLRNGMNRPIPVVTVRIDRITRRKATCEYPRLYALHIGRILKLEHWDRKKKRPK